MPHDRKQVDLSLHLVLPLAALTFALVVPDAVLAQTDDVPRSPADSIVHEYRNGRWFDGSGFVERTMYVRDGWFVDEPSTGADSAIDLQGRWVVPPFGEAHNHNVEAGPGFADRVRRYLSHGVFYVKNPNVLPSGVDSIREEVNRPTSIDVTFAGGGLTGPGGHPIGVVQRNLDRGTWTEDQGEGAFYHAVADTGDLDAAWATLLADRPDFVKTYLLYSETHDRRADDPAYVGQRGLDPDLLPPIVERARKAGLRVTTHVETAADFRHAVDAGVDEIAHLPGFRGDENNRFPEPDRFRLDRTDARRAAEADVVVVTTLGDFDELDDDVTSRRAREVFRHNLETLKEAGVSLAVGSDDYGAVGVDEAFQLLDLDVFSNLELLATWVEDTPRTIFPDRRIGRLAPGYEASFLVLERNPIEDFSAVRDIRMRVKQGVILP
jgi:hypothetical protein